MTTEMGVTKMTDNKIYNEFDRVTSSLSAFAVIHPKRGCIGRAVIKHGPCTVRAFVQIWGAEMQKGTARGGGYDRSTAAIENAVAKMNVSDSTTPEAGKAILGWRHAMSLNGATGEGVDWTRRLENLGYTVQHVLG